MNAAVGRGDGEYLVVGVDGSEPSLRAVDWAADEAVLRGVSLRVVYAHLWDRYEGSALARDVERPAGPPSPRDVAEAGARRALARHPGLRVTVEVVPEEPEYALVREGRHAAALVVGTRGRSGVAEMLLGSVSLAVAAHADCPVIVLRGSHDNQATPPVHGRVVVGVGEDVKDPAAVRFAVAEARRRGVALEAVRAWRCPARESVDHPLITGEPARLHEERAAEELETALRDVPDDLRVYRRTVEGYARRVLLDASHRADLLVVGARRRDGHVGLQLGRVAHGLLHHSACPVAVVPHREGDA
ncbi:universal stress protein [Streptomyces marokkonensis]|uniref:universal stress protein n=1 Tax=Streptomyces marokkonensis TaxID=324855 RepID=UPI0011F2F2C2|nr:universal stress protein [Streptomyces marokkonensis]